MNGENGNDVGAIFGVEVIEIGGVLEVVGENGAIFYHIIGDNVVAVFLNIQGDVLCSQDILGNSKDLSMRSGRSGHRDGLAARAA